MIIVSRSGKVYSVKKGRRPFFLGQVKQTGQKWYLDGDPNVPEADSPESLLELVREFYKHQL